MNEIFSAGKRCLSVWVVGAMAWQRMLKRIAFTLVLGIMAGSAAAGTFTFPNNAGQTALNFGSSALSVPRDKVVGTTMLATSSNPGLAWSGISCTITKTITINGTLVPGYANVYQTGVGGLGIIFYHTQNVSGGFITNNDPETLTGLSNGSTNHYVQAAFYVTGPVQNGQLLTANLPTMNIAYSGSCITTVSATFTWSANIPVTALTCTVTTPTVSVPLPSVPLTSLLPVGTVSSLSTGNTATIGLSCASGSNVYVTLTDANNAGNRSTTLSLNPSSTAHGVALRLFNGSTPVSFGPDSAVAGTQNQWLVGASSGVSSIPLTVQYLSTGPVTAGSVSAAATFTMSYQ